MGAVHWTSQDDRAQLAHLKRLNAKGTPQATRGAQWSMQTTAYESQRNSYNIQNRSLQTELFF